MKFDALQLWELLRNMSLGKQEETFDSGSFMRQVRSGMEFITALLKIKAHYRR